MRRLLFVGTLAFGSFAAGNAQALEDCSKALVLVSTKYDSNEITRLSIAWSLSEAEYNEAKKDASGNAVIYGVPVGANYSEFQQNVKTRAEMYKLDDFEKRSIAYATSSLSSNGLEAYKACLVANKGVELVVESVGTKNYQLSLVYSPSVGTGSYKWKLDESSNLTSSSEANLKRTVAALPPGKPLNQPFIISPANAGLEATVVISAINGGFGAKALLPPLHVPPPVKVDLPPIRLGSDATKYLRCPEEIAN